MTDKTLATDDTEASENTTQDQGKVYTQKEVDDMAARLKSSIARKYEKKFEDLGDVEELRALKAEAEKRKQEEQIKKGEFEKTLQEFASKKDAEIAKRDAIIREYKVDVPLVNAAAKFRAVNAEQVKQLLKSNIKLNEQGDVEVIDSEGKVRYADNGSPVTVDDLVKSFLDSNPHFVQPTPATSGTKSSHVANNPGKIDVSKLDITNNPEHREIYKNYRKSQGIA